MKKKILKPQKYLIFLLQPFIMPFTQVRDLPLFGKAKTLYSFILFSIAGNLTCVLYVYEVATHWAKIWKYENVNLKYDACPFPSYLTVHHNHSLYIASDISYQVVTIKNPETSRQDEQLYTKCRISLWLANRLT